MKILIINGPNLNLLGERDPDLYGTASLADLNHELNARFGKTHTLKMFQSNYEGAIVDCLHEHRNWADGIVINPGALTHYSYVLHDAIDAIPPPCVEVHLSDITAREEFRKNSVLQPVCVHQIKGKGFQSYFEAVHYLEQNSDD